MPPAISSQKYLRLHVLHAKESWECVLFQREVNDDDRFLRTKVHWPWPENMCLQTATSMLPSSDVATTLDNSWVNPNLQRLHAQAKLCLLFAEMIEKKLVARRKAAC